MVPLLAFLLAAAPTPVDAQTSSLLTSVVAAAAASDPRLDVLSTEDVRRAAEVDATRQLMGCDAGAGSCLAEVAAALGAGIVLHGEVGVLGESYLLSLNLFDSAAASSGGRTLVRGATLDELAREAESATRVLLDGYLTRSPVTAGSRVRVLVLDVKTRAGDAPAAAPRADPPWLLLGGGAAAAAGVAGVIVGAVFDGQAVEHLTVANDPAVDQPTAVENHSQGQQQGALAVISYVAGGALLLSGAVLATLALMVE